LFGRIKKKKKKAFREIFNRFKNTYIYEILKCT